MVIQFITSTERDCLELQKTNHFALLTKAILHKQKTQKQTRSKAACRATFERVK